MIQVTWRVALILGLLLLPALAIAQTSVAGRLEEAELHVRTRNQAAAIAIWEDLATRDVREAQYRLGIAYRSGNGVATDHAQAAMLLEKAAKNGHSRAAFALGALYQKGWGVQRSRERALEWYERAARVGHRAAQQRLDSLAASSLTPATNGSSGLGATVKDPDANLAGAIRDGDAMAALDSLHRGASVKHLDARQRTPLHDASRLGRQDTIESLLKYKANVEARDSAGVTPLMLATEEGHTKVMKRLLSASASPDSRDGLGRTALMLAARAGHLAGAKLLLSRGADPALELSDGRRAYDWARRGGHTDLAKLLASRGGASRNLQAPARDAWLRENLQASSRETTAPSLVAAARRGQKDVVETLLGDSNAAPLLESRDHQGHTALTRAAAAGHVDVVSLLLAAGADVSVSTPEGRTALSWAAGANHVDSVGRLLEHGASASRRDNEERTALSHAAESGSTEAVAELLKAGSTPKDASKFAPPVVAAREGRLDTLKLLVARGVDLERLPDALCAALRGDVQVRVVAFLVGHNAELARAQCGSDSRALDIAVQENSAEAVRILLKAGADPNGAGAMQPLLVAARRGNAEMLTLLLDAGADVNVRGPARETVLTVAATSGNEAAVLLFLERGAKVGARTSAGYTAAEIATRRGHKQIAERLNGASASLGKLLWSSD